MGVVSGLVMAYQFGTNWSFFSEFAGSVTGPLLAYEVLTAFFLEAGFLGVMLFGWTRVGPGLHFLATCMVALGTLISATWILASNSWMQTPQGYAIEQWRGGAAGLAGHHLQSLVSVPAAAHERGRLPVHGAVRRRFGRLAPAAQERYPGGAQDAVDGDVDDRHRRADPGGDRRLPRPQHAASTSRPRSPRIEGHWENRGSEALPLILFGMPDMERETTRYAIELPRLGSLILTHTWDGQIKGLKEFPKRDRPNAAIVFWSFRIMVGLGFAMIGLGLWSLCKRRGGALFTSRPFLRAALLMGPSGLVALLAGWITTEVGRQPWVVYGLMRTSDAVSAHTAGPLALTLGLFVVVYLFVFGVGIAYVLRLVRGGPQHFDADHPPEGGPGQERTPSRPMSARPPAAGATLMGIDLPVVWAVIIFFGVFMYVVMDGFDLGIGMLYPVRARPARPRRDDEHRRAGVGRQRDLAGAGRRRPAGGVPAGLFDHPQRAVPAADLHAAGADLPRRRLRIPLQGDATTSAISGTRRSSAAR